ncbi:MAG TPA: hypothetical protein PLX15_01435 [Candidatus Woesearchaeota archaeon]|nr:hypothetical protein [Candidatus Woesearchaeota archaeon]
MKNNEKKNMKINANSQIKNNLKQKAIFGIILTTLMISLTIAGFTYAQIGSPKENNPNYDQVVHDQLIEAIKSNDYEQWIKIREENNLPTHGKMFQVINKDNFEKYKELHNANLQGDFETANNLKKELGLGVGQMKKGIDGSIAQGKQRNSVADLGLNSLGFKSQGFNCQLCQRVRN